MHRQTLLWIDTKRLIYLFYLGFISNSVNVIGCTAYHCKQSALSPIPQSRYLDLVPAMQA